MKYINSNTSVGKWNIPNRILIHPMEGCDGKTDGSPDELTKRRYRRFAESGAGIIWFEAVAVCPEGRANPRQLWLHKENVDEFKKLLDEIREISLEKFGYAPIIIIQSTHSGRYSKPCGNPAPIVAYRNSLWEKGKEEQPFVVASDEYCKTIPSMYAEAAALAEQAGFDGIDVKCCHGYLFGEFLSAFSREGEYGGSFENRTRLYFECIDAVKKSISDSVFVTTRLNSCDCFPYPFGFGVNSDNEIDLTETKLILQKLKEKGIELVNITIGNPYLIPHINRPYNCDEEDGMIGVERVVGITEKLQKTFPDMKLVMSALTYMGTDSIDFAEKCLEEKKCCFVGFGRMAFAYPQFYAEYIKNGKLDKNKVCIKCGNCSKMMRAGGVAGCPVRDREVYMPLYRKYMGGK